MLRLSDRLQMIADQIEPGETMADIGCDHGFLPIYLRLTEKSPKVIVADVSVPSLAKAASNARLHGFCAEAAAGDGMRMAADARGKDDAGMDFRAGNGLSVLAPGEVDAVVIAGMGGKLIRDIMAADLEHTCSFKRFVLQPRIGQGYLRKWLLAHGFAIIKESLVVEGSHIAEIITAVSPGWMEEMGTGSREADAGEGMVGMVGMVAGEGSSPAAEGRDSAHTDFPVVRGMQDGADAQGNAMIWKIPPWMIHAQGPVIDFLTRSLAGEQEKLSNVMRARTRDMRLEQTICHDIDYLKRLIEECENGQQKRYEK